MRLPLPLLVFAAVLPLTAPLWADPNFKVAWPDSMEATVKERMTLKGETTVFRYGLAVTRDPATGNYRWERRNAQVIDFGDQRVPANQMQDLPLKVIAAIGGKTLTIVCNSRGYFQALPNVDKVADDFDAFVKSSPPEDAAHMKKMRDMMEQTRTQFGKFTLSNAGKGEWQTWVGEWVDFEAPENGAKEGPLRRKVSEGQPALRGKVKCTYLGAAPKDPSLVSVKEELTIEDPSMLASVKDSMKKFGSPENPDDIKGVSAKSTFEAFLDPKKLLPHWAKVTRDVQLEKASGVTTETGREIHEYEFEWKQP